LALQARPVEQQFSNGGPAGRDDPFEYQFIQRVVEFAAKLETGAPGNLGNRQPNATAATS
jgi:hypothetical protein